MKIVCDACSAKYSIADEKVKGKVFKIRCKKCSNIIVVRGNAGAGAEEPAAAAPAGGFDQKETRVYDYGEAGGGFEGAPPGDDAVWHVVIDQEQVGPISVAEVQQRFAAGEIDSETYIWREGFTDWLPLTQVPDFASLVTGGSTTTAQPSSGQDAVSSMFGAANYDEGGTSRSDPNDVFAAHAAKAGSSSDDDDGAGNLFGGSARGGKGASPAEGGLFGAGGASASGSGKAAASAGGGASSMKGQRSENSVLFSLNNLAALASDSPKAAAAAPASSGGGGASGAAQHGGGEGSGLIDIRSMASAYLGPAKPGATGKPGGNVGSMDDLPVFSTASFSEPAVIIPSMGASRGANKMMYILLAAVAALAVIAVVLVVVVLSKKDTPAATAAGGTVSDGTGKGTTTAAGGGTEPGGGTGDGPGTSAGTAAGAGTGDGTGDGAGTGGGSLVASNDNPPTGEKPIGDKPVKPTSDKPVKPTSDKPTKPSGDKPTKPPPDKPEKPDKPDKPTNAGCIDEVACLLADKPPACCAKYGKTNGGGGGGGGGGGTKPPPPSNLPEDLTKSDISAGVAKVRGRVDGCAAKSSAKGTVKVSVKVAPGGSVSSVTVKETPDPGLGSCVASAMQKASFTKTQNGGSFSYPFKF